MRRFRFWLICAVIATASAPLHAQERVNVVASFSILGDFVKNVGGDRIDVTTLVGPNGDVHVYDPAPSDARKIAGAKLLVINGLGLEGWLPRLLQSSGGRAPIMTATKGIAPLKVGSDADPHAWQSVANAKIYVTNISDALVAADPHDRTGLRARLNLGHTFGHALEALSGFELAHGLAVGVGLVVASRLAAECGLCDSALAERVRTALLGLGLPVALHGYAPESVLAAMRSDKKRSAGRVILPITGETAAPLNETASNNVIE